MKVLSDNIGSSVTDKLNSSAEVRIAVAYFSPDDKLLEVLQKIPRLRLIISEEFSINNPYKLEVLSKTADIRSVPPDSVHGKLHSKVIIGKQFDESKWGLVGSANLTWQGFFSNREACIVLDSREETDQESLDSIDRLFNKIWDISHAPDLEQAKKIFDARSEYRLERSGSSTDHRERCFALKTTSGSTGEQHWPSFLEENVVAIGWSDIEVNPSEVSDSRLKDALRSAYEDRSPNRSAIKIRKFVNLMPGDRILICRGYSHTASENVHIYGFARVIGPFYDDRSSRWWRFKHDAEIQTVDQDVPLEIVERALQMRSLREAIHDLDFSNFRRLLEELRMFGIRTNI